MMRAPKRAMASLVARGPFNLGTNMPVKISSALGLACTITVKKQQPSTITSKPITPSSFLIYQPKIYPLQNCKITRKIVRQNQLGAILVTASQLLTPYRCSPRSRRVFNPASRTPIHMGTLKRMWRANAVPTTVKIISQ